MNSSSTIMDEVCRKHFRSDCWNFLTTGLHNGDVYLVLTLIRYFAIKSGAERKIRFVADSQGKYAVLKMFVEDLGYIAIEEGLGRLRGDALTAWLKDNDMSRFEPGGLQRLHPVEVTGDRINIAPIVYSKGVFNLSEIFKVSLRLPLSISPTPPRVSAESRERARHLFEGYNLELSKTIILFPYAQTISFDAQVCLSQFAKMALNRGFIVLTAVHGAERVIENTVAVKLQFDTLIPFCELAGTVVSVRSGIGDMLSSASLRKLYLYSSEDFMRHENPNAYGLCDCSRGVLHKDASQTAEELFAGMADEPFSRVEDYVPFSVLSYLETIPLLSGSVLFNSRSGCRLGRVLVFREAVLGYGWSELELWGIWSVGLRSVLYLRMPDNLAAADVEVFLHLELKSAKSPVDVTLWLNGRAIVICIQGSVKLAILLTEADRRVRIHRIIFDVRTPQSSASDSRILGLGLKAAHYLPECLESATLLRLE